MKHSLLMNDIALDIFEGVTGGSIAVAAPDGDDTKRTATTTQTTSYNPYITIDYIEK